MSPATLNSLSQAAEALPFVQTARRYYRFGWFSEVLGSAPPESVTLRKDHYRYSRIRLHDTQTPPQVLRVSRCTPGPACLPRPGLCVARECSPTYPRCSSGFAHLLFGTLQCGCVVAPLGLAVIPRLRRAPNSNSPRSMGV
ncbi:unnamed protein product [Pleuronectes platessa]|uniref:Uncharacterized protein n=1 Tax=Pleuronectes platessa TaxID=8262 RepID=A0A9N7VIL5_PLEPL|nr:unnamed protein product [Pleuronectes platessa]